MNQYRKSPYSWILIGFVIIGLISALVLVHKRHHIEAQQMSIENIVDYDAVVRASSFEKRSLAEGLQALRDVGITGMAIYDRTLAKAADAGEILLFTGDTVSSDFRVSGGFPLEGTTFIAPAPNKEEYFREIQEDLVLRLGKEKVNVVNTTKGVMIALKQPHEALVDMNLSISRLQAREVERLGFHIIVRPSNFKEVTRHDVDHVFKRIEGISGVTGMVFVGKEALGYPHHLDVVDSRLKQSRIPLVGIEAVNQLQYAIQAGFNELVVAHDYEVGRLYTVSKEEVKKLTPKEISQWFYISDLERNIRYNLFPVYDQGVDNHTALETTIQYIKGVTERLKDRGYTFGIPSIYPSYSPNPILHYLVLLGTIALGVITLSLYVYMGAHRQITLFVLLALLGLVGLVATSGVLISQMAALVAAIAAPVATIILLMECWRGRASQEEVSSWNATLQAVGYLAGATALAAIGGMYIASLMGDTKSFMEFTLFRGVKLVFIAPVVLTAIAYIQRFPLWKGREIRSLEDSKQFLKEFLTTDIKVYTLVIAGLLAFTGYVFIGRSGHTAGVAVPSFELMLRRFLENTLYARPREKEFLIGHPALMLAVFAWLKRWPMVLHFLFTMAGVIGIASMVQTFCHLRTPVWMSISRGFDGMLLGILCGMVAIVVFRFLMYGASWCKHQGGKP